MTNPSNRGVARRLAQVLEPVMGKDLPVQIRAWDGSIVGPSGTPVLEIRNRRALRRMLWSPGELGLARAYVSGDIDVDGDLLDAFRRVWRHAREHSTSTPALTVGQKFTAARTAARLGAIGQPPKPPASEARLQGKLHSMLRDRAAISHHYDLSNEFYELLLDKNMAYSSAYWTQPESADYTVSDAQTDKLDLICRKLGLRDGMRLLDIGCGWGSLLLHAAEHYGVHATGVTLSKEQREFVGKRIADRGLDGRVEVRLMDYRELPKDGERFDAVSSIEMGEHVGLEQYPTYVATMFACLKPTGRLLLQQMSHKSGAAPGGGPFIESYIAPDMHMRPLAQTLGFIEQGGFEVRDVESIREHYVWTVRAWIDTFESNQVKVRDLVGEEVERVWRLYLVGGALAFEENRMGVDQILSVKPDPAGDSGMPATRPWAVAAN